MLQKSTFAFAKSLFQHTSHFFSSPAFQRQTTVIIGAGLSGLYAGNRFQRMGFDTLIVDKKSYAGGSCHSIMFNDLSYEIGCNTFSYHTIKMMEDIGIPNAFKPVRNQIILPNSTTINIPLDSTSMKNLTYPLDWFRLLYSVYQADSTATLESITEDLHSLAFKHTLYSMIAYTLFRSPKKIPIDLVKNFFKNPDGYEKPVCYDGGTLAFIGALASNFKRLGGNMQLNSTCTEISRKANGKKEVKIINNETGEEQSVLVDLVISTNPGESHSTQTTPSLSVSALLIEVANCDFVKDRIENNIYTTIFSTPPSFDWLSTHERGELASEFGFHCINNDLTFKNTGKGTHALTIFFLTPKDMRRFSREQENGIKDYITDSIDKSFPGFKTAIQHTRLISPEDYKLEFDFNSAVSQGIPSPEFKPSRYDGKQFYIGSGMKRDGQQNAYGAFCSVDDIMNDVILYLEGLEKPNATNEASTTISPK
jgi:hypothetical protein